MSHRVVIIGGGFSGSGVQVPASALRARPGILRLMASQGGPRRSPTGRLLDALIWGVALGAAGGAVLGAAISGVGAGVGAVVGALLYAPAEALTTLRRAPAEPKPIWQRIFASALLMALFGWLLGLRL